MDGQNDYLGMSDAEILAAPMPVDAPVETTDTPVTVEAEPVENTPAEGETTAEIEPSDKPEGEESEANGGESGNAPEVVENGDAPAEELKPETKEATAAVDYEAEYKKLLAPFRANGREVKVESVEDALALMQMGANYNKKMAAMKPNIKLLKLLENNGLLSEEKISFLIDLEKKSPEAISKLVKDSGLNPMDLDTDKAGEYQPKIHSVDDREVELDTVLDEIQETPTYTQTLEIVSKKWDGASKQTVANSPQLLKVINDHVASGIYTMISEEVERERLFGRLNNLSDIEAYRQVGDAIQARGGFNHLVPNQGKPAAPAKVVVQPKPKASTEDALNQKRRAASSTKPANTSTVNADAGINPLELSDEAFAKLSEIRFR